MYNIDDFDFRAFLRDRPAINKTALARELQVDVKNLQKIIEGDRDVPRAKRGLFMKVLKTYGADITIINK